MREFLKGLELDDELIDTIMAEHGKHLTRLKEQVDDYKEKVSNYDNQIKELNTKIETNSKDLENYEKLTNENKDLKAQLQMGDSNVKKEFREFVTEKVMSQVNDDNDFASVLESYKKENPQFFGGSETRIVQTSPVLGGGATAPQTTNSIMNDILRSASNE